MFQQQYSFVKEVNPRIQETTSILAAHPMTFQDSIPSLNI